MAAINEELALAAIDDSMNPYEKELAIIKAECEAAGSQVKLTPLWHSPRFPERLSHMESSYKPRKPFAPIIDPNYFKHK